MEKLLPQNCFLYDQTLNLQVGKILGLILTVCTGVGCYDEPSLSIYATHHLPQATNSVTLASPAGKLPHTVS